ncbi:MAG: triose-phosphate isomerase [Candidatus Puniceispirillaceae bacterium]
MIVAANWKMHLTRNDAKILADSYGELVKSVHHTGVHIIAFPPALYAPYLDEAQVPWGAQSCHAEPFGAYTGDISAPMFASAGANYQLVGHSERRSHHKETDQMIASQLVAAQKQGLQVILCVGENLSQRDAGTHESVVMAQLDAACAEADWEKLIIAYEPVWAIGTGRVADSSDVNAMHKAIADHCMARLKAPRRPAILYGGSVKASNANDLFCLPYVDGALVGGASLKLDEFDGILQVAREHVQR